MTRISFDGVITDQPSEKRIVPSSRGGDKTYEVDVRNGHVLDCTCLGHHFGHVCTHMKAVQADIDAKVAIDTPQELW